MKCGNNNLSSVRGLVSQLVGYECGISRSFMFDGLFVSVYSNSFEFFKKSIATGIIEKFGAHCYLLL